MENTWFGWVLIEGGLACGGSMENKWMCLGPGRRGSGYGGNMENKRIWVGPAWQGSGYGGMEVWRISTVNVGWSFLVGFGIWCKD